MHERKSRLEFYLNIGHAFDHLLMLIFPTVVLALAAHWQRRYSELLPLSLGGFVAFGACSLPAGWLADRWSRVGMMTVFFFGMGAATIATGLAQTPQQIAVGLTFIGVFGAIYHPVGTAMLVANASRVGRTLGVSGVYGNVGLAVAALIAGVLADFAGWRAAFFVPGLLMVATGVGFVLEARDVATPRAARSAPAPIAVIDRRRVVAAIAVAIACSGLIFNATTVSMPKVFDERLAALTQTTTGIGLLVCGVYLIAAMAQLVVGTLIDRISPKAVLLAVAGAQVPLLLIAGATQGYAMLAVAVLMMFFVFGQIPINDAMIARYTAEHWRARAYALRYVVSLTASAMAVPLIALVHRAYGGFAPLFTTLGAAAALTLAAALMLPREPVAIPAAARA